MTASPSRTRPFSVAFVKPWANGMSIPEELARREERLAKLAEARAKLDARAKERFEREMAEHRAKLAARDEKRAASGKKPAADPRHHRSKVRSPWTRST
jgi:3-mercaptopyruvate sulfurtransferase SseA